MEKALHSSYFVHSIKRHMSALSYHKQSTLPELEVICLNKQGIPLEERRNVLQAV